MTGPNYDKLFLQGRLQVEVHEDLIKRYIAFYEGAAPEELIKSYKEKLGDLTAEEPLEEPTSEKDSTEVPSEEPKAPAKKTKSTKSTPSK